MNRKGEGNCTDNNETRIIERTSKSKKAQSCSLKLHRLGSFTIALQREAVIMVFVINK